jgi:hypothetical protein
MSRRKGAIQPAGQTNTPPKKPFFIVDTNYIYTILIAKISIVKQFDPKSQFSLLTQAFKFTKDEIHVPIKHKAKVNENWGRTYNVFCSLHSHERLALGYISYDMNAALQSISLQLIKATREDYPTLWDYTHDKAYKKQIRAKIAQALGIEVGDVKAKLTAFANGSTRGVTLHPYYKLFQEESERLRRAVLKYVSETEPEVLERATEQSKRELPEELDWSDTESQETTEDMRDRASVFFFVWTWYERKIREAMLEELEDGIEVHDAVYSKQDIPAETIQNTIRDFTGFNIIIDKEMPEG